MNKHYTTLLVGLCLFLWVPNTALACGYAWISDCSAQVHLRINGAVDSFNVADCPFGYNFDGIQLGNIQSVSIANAKAITWESCQNNVSAVLLRYRVYELGFPGGAWQTLNLPEYHQTIEGPYTTRYRGNPVDISLISGLTVGKTYTLEVYLQAEVDTIGDDFIPETSFYRNNNGSNYKLSFTYGGATAPPLALLSHLTQPTCNGASDGKISVSVYGNLTGIFYHWSNINLNFFQQSSLPAGAYAITVNNALGQSAVANIQLTQPAPVQPTFSNVQSVGCNNSPGSATVNASGGTGPYRYQWENGQQTPTATLTYSANWKVTITDAHQCSAIGTVFIGNTGQVQRTVTSSICTGQAYSLSGHSFSTGGSYSFTVPGVNGCDTLIQLTLNELNPWQAFATLPENATLTCTTPNVLLCAAALPDASYFWSKDGIPLLEAPCVAATAGGNYQLKVTLGDCIATKEIATTEHLTAPEVELTGTLVLYCTGAVPGWLMAHTNATSPTYSWVYDGQEISTSDSCLFHVLVVNNGVPELPSLTVTDLYGCQRSSPVNHVVIEELTTPPQLSLSATDASNFHATDGAASVTIAGGLSPYAIEWGNGASTPVIDNLGPGNYCVTVVGANGCPATECVTVGYPLGLDAPSEHALHIWPNITEAGRMLEIKLPFGPGNEPMDLELLDGQGKILQVHKTLTGIDPGLQFQVPHDLAEGAYWLRLTQGAHSFVGRIFIQ